MSELLIQAESLRNILLARATGGINTSRNLCTNKHTKVH